MSGGPSAPAAQSPGGVLRVHWVPGTDRLHGVCYCGAEREFEDPVELWDWLLAHPGPLHDTADSPALSV